ncbi:hypothetical protein ACFV3R_16475 [Streptomyces sp. NPDC059740]|uniref:hypothetical protein n=1 Tax=Streptomyces sp. NPDC059740 TaxID=3346926 RepID=UPI003647CC93
MFPSSTPSTAELQPTAAEVNEAIRAFARARRGRAWTTEERAAYARLLTAWTRAAGRPETAGV